MAADALTPQRRAIVAAICFLLAAVCAGIVPGPRGPEYRVFSLPAGVFALLVAWAMVDRGAWRVFGRVGWIAPPYGLLASAQITERLLPGPGILQWTVLTALALSAWGTLGRGSRKRLAVSLGSLALLLATLKFSVVPRIGAADPAASRTIADRITDPALRLIASPDVVTVEAQLWIFAAVLLWVAATRLLWTGGEPTPPPAVPVP